MHTDAGASPAPGDAGVARARREIAAVVGLTIGYVVLQRWIAARWYFIVPALVAGLAWLVWTLARSGRTATDYGVGRRGLLSSSIASATIVGLTLAASLAWPAGADVAAGDGVSRGFWIALAAYPVWGVAQQFLFQGILHENLIRLGARWWWSVPCTSAVFVAAHHPSRRLMIATAIGGLLFSAIYRRHRNVVPIGIAHGMCAAIVYEFVFHRDLFGRFLGL